VEVRVVVAKAVATVEVVRAEVTVAEEMEAATGVAATVGVRVVDGARSFAAATEQTRFAPQSGGRERVAVGFSLGGPRGACSSLAPSTLLPPVGSQG
jgi:hypothetical protein